MSEQEKAAVDILKSKGFVIDDKVIILSDELPMLNTDVQGSISYLCLECDYECSFEAY